MVGDEMGVVKFIVWKELDVPELKEGECYVLENVTVGAYGDRLEVSISKRTKIEKNRRRNRASEEDIWSSSVDAEKQWADSEVR